MWLSSTPSVLYAPHGLAATRHAAPVMGPRDAPLAARIARFYDASSELWIDTWGEHMHHGFYDAADATDAVVTYDHVQAQVRMIDEVLDWAVDARDEPTTVLDVGCGVGGSSRHIAMRYQANVTGITLSPVQAERARRMSTDDRTHFLVADAMEMPFADETFDLVWSLESGEHMPDKEAFVRELLRVCKENGTIVIVAWCHRENSTALEDREVRVLRKLSRAYCIPEWSPPSAYARALEEAHATDVRVDDWTRHVLPFWKAVIRSSMRPRALAGLVRSGLFTVVGALAMPLMVRGQKRGLITFALVMAKKTKKTKRNGRAPPPSMSATYTDALPKPARAATNVAPRAIVAFTRPHTVLGTVASVVALATTALRDLEAPARLAFLATTLVPCLLANVFVVGLNQIHDVAIDRVSKPWLPLACDAMSPAQAWTVVVASVAGALTLVAAPARFGSVYLQTLVVGSIALGWAYSAPPLRLKTRPALAAASIVLVRGLLTNAAVLVHASLFATRPVHAAAVGALTLYFSLYAVLIAVAKDIPDVFGDAAAGIPTYSVRAGWKPVFVACKRAYVLLQTAALATLARLGIQSPSVALVAGAVAIAWNAARVHGTEIEQFDTFDIRDFYMRLWRGYYLSYAVVPALL